MGLADYILEGVVREHRYRAVSGSVVQIGRQTMELTVPTMSALFTQYGLPLDAFRDGEIEIDRQTSQVRETGVPFVSDRFFFGALGAAEVHAVDHSNFEGADIVHDMNLPIDRSLEGIADLIVDGSTLDNVHDAATALMNYNRMLRPGGRVVSGNAAKPDIEGAYSVMSPEWFLDYYAANDYADCRLYVQLNFGNNPQALLALDYGWVMEHGRVPTITHDGWVYAFVYAEKGPTSSWDRIPTRARFRSPAEHAQWQAAIARFAASDRPSHLTTRRGDFVPPPGFVTAR